MKRILALSSGTLFALTLLAPSFAAAQAPPAAAPAAPAAPAKPAPVVRPKAIVVGDMAPNFELPVFDSATPFKMADLKGKKAVALAFTQSACASCRTELELMNGYVGKSANLEVVAVNVDAAGGKEKWNGIMKQYIADSGLKMPFLVDPKMSLGRMFGVRATPGLVVIGKDGKVKAIEVGFAPGEDQEKFSEILDGVK